MTLPQGFQIALMTYAAQNGSMRAIENLALIRNCMFRSDLNSNNQTQSSQPKTNDNDGGVMVNIQDVIDSAIESSLGNETSNENANRPQLENNHNVNVIATNSNRPGVNDLKPAVSSSSSPTKNRNNEIGDNIADKLKHVIKTTKQDLKKFRIAKHKSSESVTKTTVKDQSDLRSSNSKEFEEESKTGKTSMAKWPTNWDNRASTLEKASGNQRYKLFVFCV